MIHPLSSREEVQAELDEIENQIDVMGRQRVIDGSQFQRRLFRLELWARKLREQLAEMEAA